MISGEPFAGKTMFMLAMMASLDSGEPLFGAFQPIPAQRALFLGQDAPTWDYFGQFQKLARGMGLGAETRISYPSFLVLNMGHDLTNPNSIKYIEDGIDLFAARVLFLDTLLEFHSLDENSNTEMKKVMGLLKHLRDKHHLSIFFTTHTTKSTEGKSSNYRARGAGTISGSVDQHILISPSPEGIKIKTPKLRGGDRKSEVIYITFNSSLVDGQPALRMDYTESPYKSRQDLILAFLVAGPKPRKEIAAMLAVSNPDWSPQDVQFRTTNTLRFLEMKKVVHKTERGVYALAPSGEKNLEPTGRQAESK